MLSNRITMINGIVEGKRQADRNAAVRKRGMVQFQWRMGLHLIARASWPSPGNANLQIGILIVISDG